MGGLGSGRWKDRTRKTVESHLTVDINQLREKGCLRPGWSSTCQWTDGNEVALVNLLAEADRLSLSYTLRVRDGKSEDMTEIIPIVHLPCRFGGSRPYFICPGPTSGCANERLGHCPLWAVVGSGQRLKVCKRLMTNDVRH
jgi:hypothetical protein